MANLVCIMTRPETINELERVYQTMTTKWLSSPYSWKVDPLLANEDVRTCLAIYTLNHWKLEPHVWSRLVSWITPLLQFGVLYTPNPTEQQGLLHFTFHQCSSFRTTHSTLDTHSLAQIQQQCKEFLSPLAGLQLVFRGLCVTPTGIALRGFPLDDIQCKRLMKTRNSLPAFFDSQGVPFEAPYINDICHATLFRWTSQPSTECIEYIQRTLHMWNEAVIANYCASSWTLGFGTYLMNLPHRQDVFTCYTPLYVCHRGLTQGPSHEHENNLETILMLTQRGIHVECDIWKIGDTLYLGHDLPQTPITLQELQSQYLWIHAKNKDALEYLLYQRNKCGIPLRIFWHTTEDYCFTTSLECIVYPGKPLLQDSVFMMPEMTTNLQDIHRAHSVCSDFVRLPN